MGRSPCCDKANVKRGPWSPDEDATLINYLQTHGTGGNWITLPRKAGLRRCGKSCRLRWLNYLRPDIKHGCFTEEEDTIICSLYNKIGSRWSFIASHLPGRTDNDVKNYWNSKLKKRLFGGKIYSSINSSETQCLASIPEIQPYYSENNANSIDHNQMPPLIREIGDYDQQTLEEMQLSNFTEIPSLDAYNNNGSVSNYSGQSSSLGSEEVSSFSALESGGPSVVLEEDEFDLGDFDFDLSNYDQLLNFFGFQETCVSTDDQLTAYLGIN